MGKVLWWLTGMLAAQAALAQTPPPPPPPPCSSAEAKQFEFWVGNWDLSWKNPDGTSGRGSNRVEAILGGCAIHENFEDTAVPPFVGRSYSVYTPRLKKWQQTWVDSTGSYLDFTGEVADGRMVLAREATLPNGKPGRQRMTFYNIGRDALDWDWETSEDLGKTWTLRWRIHYKRK